MLRLDTPAHCPDPQLPWKELLDGSADRYDGLSVTIVGWTVTADEATTARYGLLTFEPVCCRGCLPSDPATCVEVFADAPVPTDGQEMV